MDALDIKQRQRYHELAVFSGAGPVPRSAVEALWDPVGCSSTDAGDLLRLFTGRSLLRHDDGHIGLHDLQYDVATYYLRQRPGGVPAGHAQLLDGYRRRLSAHLTTSEDTDTVFLALPGQLLRRPESDPLRQEAADGYLLNHLAAHLASAGQADELHALLVSYDWLALGLKVRDFGELLADFLHAPSEDGAVHQVRGTLQLSSQVLMESPAALPAQLLGRMLANPDVALQPLLTAAATARSGPWLRPRRASLIAPGGLLQFVLAGHTGTVEAVAVSGDGTRAITGDGMIRLWDLAAGRQIDQWRRDIGEIVPLGGSQHLLRRHQRSGPHLRPRGRARWCRSSRKRREADGPPVARAFATEASGVREGRFEVFQGVDGSGQRPFEPAGELGGSARFPDAGEHRFDGAGGSSGSILPGAVIGATRTLARRRARLAHAFSSRSSSRRRSSTRARAATSSSTDGRAVANHRPSWNTSIHRRSCGICTTSTSSVATNSESVTSTTPGPSHRARQAPREPRLSPLGVKLARRCSPTGLKHPNSGPPLEIQPLNQKLPATAGLRLWPSVPSRRPRSRRRPWRLREGPDSRSS